MQASRGPCHLVYLIAPDTPRGGLKRLRTVVIYGMYGIYITVYIRYF